MAIQEISFTLSACYPDGRPIEPNEFVAGLGVEGAPYEVYGRAEQWRAVGLRIATIGIAPFEHLGTERYGGFDAAVQEALLQFADWLASIQAENINRLHATGLKVYLLATLLMDRDQFDFTLPPKLSVQLGRLGLRLSMLSNE